MLGRDEVFAGVQQGQVDRVAPCAGSDKLYVTVNMHSRVDRSMHPPGTLWPCVWYGVYPCQLREGGPQQGSS